MPVPRLVTDVVIGGLWLASAVKVAGYTWSSVQSTWQKMPAPDGTTTATASPGASPNATNPVSKAQAKKDPNQSTGIGGFFDSVLSFVTNPFGRFGSHDPWQLGVNSAAQNAQLARMNALPQPPRSMYNAIRASAATKDKTALDAATRNLHAWAQTVPGWNRNDVSLYTSYVVSTYLQNHQPPPVNFRPPNSAR